jgi:hypothetical protein
MSDLALFDNNNSFDYAAVGNRLEDLAQFGVHLHPVLPANKCGVCRGYVGWPWSDGWGYDILCQSCLNREGGSDAFYGRIYTNQTVFVADPIITKGSKLDPGDGVYRQVHHSLLYGLIVVDKQLCLIRASLAHIPDMEDMDWPTSMYPSDLCDLTTGEAIVSFVFHINYSKLFALGQTQPPL